MKRNFKYVKTRKTKVNHMSETVAVFKKASANLTTWAPGRSLADIKKMRDIRALEKLERGLVNYFGPRS